MQGGALEGKRKSATQRSKSYLYTKFFDALTQVEEALLKASAGKFNMQVGNNSCTLKRL